MDNIQTPKTKRPPKPADTNAKKKWYDTLFAELDTGRDIQEVAEEFGVTVGSINMARGQRKRAESKRDGSSVISPEKKAKRTQRVATPSDTTPEETSLVMTPQDENYMTKSELFTELTYMRVNKVMESVVSGDNPKVKAAALTMVRELIDQSEKRSEVRE